MKKIKLSIFTILILFVCTTVNALTIQQKWVQEEAPISGDFLSYQRLFSIGNDVVAIGNYGWNEGHNIVRYDTNGNKLWSTETDYYTDFRLNDESIEALYSYGDSNGISIIDYYDENGKITNEFNEILDAGVGITFAGKKLFKVITEEKSNLVKIYEIGMDGETIHEYETYLSENLTFQALISPQYIPEENMLLFSAYTGVETKNNGKYHKNIIFSFDIDKEEFSEEFSFKSPVSAYKLSRNGFFVTYDGEYYHKNNKLYTENSKITSVNNYNNTKVLGDFFQINGSYKKDNNYYLSGYDANSAILYKLDKNLETVWNYRYESEEEYSTLKNMIEINDYIFILYETEIPNGEEAHIPVSQNRYNSVLVLDNKGNLVMEYALDSEELQGGEFHNIIESDDGFIVAGEIYDEENAANAIIAEFTVIFNITTKTDGNGTITPSTTTEHSGNEVTFVVTPNEGYVLSEVKVTDENGNVIIFTDYKFTMPSANVLIEATFVKEEKNPETSDIIIITITILILSGVILTFVNHKKNDVI